MSKKTLLTAAAKSAALPAGYADVRSGIVELLGAARMRHACSVNALMTASYWDIGRRIVEAEQQGKRRAGYGEQLIARLSSDLSAVSAWTIWNTCGASFSRIPGPSFPRRCLGNREVSCFPENPRLRLGNSISLNWRKSSEFFEHVHDPLAYFDRFDAKLLGGGLLVTGIMGHHAGFMHASPQLGALASRNADIKR